MSKVVLLVEDDEDNRDLVSFVIARSRLDVSLLIAENGQEAIDKAFATPPNLILMDMQMPVMDGWHAVPILKADSRTKDVPVIAFTAQAKPEDKQRAREMGCSDYYTKPMDPEELLNLMKKYL
jgi:two-component system, cell cycle response regulator DivK